MGQKMRRENLKGTIQTKLKLTQMELHETARQLGEALADAAACKRALWFAARMGVVTGLAFGLWAGWLLWGG